MILGADTVAVEAAWHSFLEQPADYADPERLASCFGGTISAAACAKMLATERLRPRLSKLLCDHYQLAYPADRLPSADEAIALSPAERFNEIAARAGAIYWADAIAGTILGRQAAILQEQLGASLCQFAVANRDLAGPVRTIEPIEGLGERVRMDGWRCVAAWCHALPASIGQRIRLKLPPLELLDGTPEPPFLECGLAIVRRAVREEG